MSAVLNMVGEGKHQPVAEIDCDGAALTPELIARVETLLRPLSRVVDLVDLRLLNVSIEHLNLRAGQTAK